MISLVIVKQILSATCSTSQGELCVQQEMLGLDKGKVWYFSQVAIVGDKRQKQCLNIVTVGPIWLDNVNCNIEDEILDDCEFNPWGINNCNHRSDVGVICKPSELINSYTPTFVMLATLKVFSLFR